MHGVGMTRRAGTVSIYLNFKEKLSIIGVIHGIIPTNPDTLQTFDTWNFLI